jgi:hypothetical protein
MRYLSLLALLLTLLLAPAPAAQAAGCDAGRFHAADGSVTANCYVVSAEVAGFRCEPFAFIDGGGIGAASARDVAERYGRIDCAEQASHALYGDLMTGNRLSDGSDAGMRIRTAEVRVLSVERR